MAAAAAHGSMACRPSAKVGFKGATFGGKKIPLAVKNTCGLRRPVNNEEGGRRAAFRVDAGSLREDLFGSKEPLFPKSQSSKVSIVGAGEAASGYLFNTRIRTSALVTSIPPPLR